MKDRTHAEITREEYPNARIGGFSKMHVYQNRKEGESHNSYKKRVAYLAGRRKHVGGGGQFPAFPYSSGEEHKKAFAKKHAKSEALKKAQNKE